MKKKIILSFVGLIVIAIGIFAAYFVVEANKEAATIEDSDAKFTSDLLEIKDDSKPEEHNAYDVVAMALWKLANTDSFRTETEGTADASIATQLIAGERIVIGDNAMVRSISSGFVSVGSERFFYKDKVLLREPESINGVEATFKTDEPECLTIDGYINRYGWLPFQATGYIISKDTYLAEPTIEQNSDGTYTIKMDLNPDGDYAPFWYRREVLTNSSSTIIPEFKKIHLELTIDSTYTILKNDIQEEYQVKSMGVTATSKTNVHETFYYDNVSFPEEIISFYSQYANMSASNGEDKKKELDNLTLITESLVGKKSNFAISVDINDEVINGNVFLNLIDIDKVNVMAELLDNSIYVEYSDNLYLSYGNIKLKLDINELTSLIPASDAEGESALDVSKIISDIQNGKVSKVDNLTVLSTTLDIAGIKINVIFEMKVTEEEISMQSISGNIKLGSFDIKVNLRPTDYVVEKRDTTDFQNIMDSKEIITKIIDIVSTKKIDLALNLAYNDFKVNGILTIDFNNSLLVYGDINLIYKDELFNLKLTYADDTIYLDFKNIHAKVSVSSIFSIFDMSNLLSNTDKIKITELLLSDDLKNLITFKDLSNNIEILIKATSLNNLLKLELLNDDLDILLTSNENSVNLALNILDLNVKLTKSENNIEINPDNYVDLSTLINEGYNLYQALKDGSRININAVINLKELANIDLTIGLDGYIDLFINDNNIAISGILNVKLGNNNIEVKLLFENNTLTVELLNNTIKLTIDEIKNLINEITTRFNLGNTKLDLNISELLNGISLTDNGLKIDLSSMSENLGVIDLLVKDKIEISSNIFNASISLADLGDKVTFSDDAITYEDIITLLDKVNIITDIINDKKLELALSFSYNKNLKANIIGTIDFNDLDNIKAKANLKLNYNEYLFDIKLTFINNKIYLDFNNIHGVISLATLKSLIPSNDNSFNLDINNIIDLVFKLLKDINFKKLKLTLAKDEINNLINEYLGNLFKLDDDLVIDLDLTDKINVAINLFDINIDIAKSDKEIVVDDDSYISLDNMVINLVDIVKDIMDGTRININANINLSELANIDLSLGLTGYIDLIKENDEYIISSILNVKVSNTTIAIKLLFENNTLTVEILNNTIKLSLDEIKNLINEITTRFNLGNTKFELNINDILSGISLTDNGIKANLSSLFDKLGEVSVNITDKINVANTFFDAEISFGNTEGKVSFEGEVIEYQDIIAILDKVDTAIDVINDKKFDLDLALDYKDLHVEALGTIDFSNGIKADILLKLADFEINIKFINNVIYLDFQNIHGKLKLETIKKLLPINTNFNININEVIDLVFNLVDEINIKDLSLSLKKDEVNALLDKYLGFITIEDNLNIKLDIADNINLSVSLFNTSLTISKTDKEIVVNEDNYSELGYLIERIYDIYQKAKDGKRININALVDLSKFTNIDLSIGLDGYVDFFINEGKVTLSSILNLKIGSHDIEIKLLFNDDVVTLELLNNVIKLSVNDIKELISEISTKFIKLGTNNNEATIDVVSLLKSIILTEDSVSVDLSSFAEMLGVITLKVTDNDIKVINNGISASVTLADTQELVTIDDTNAIDKVYLETLFDNVSYILDILNEKKLGINLALEYKDISLKAEGTIDFSDKLKLDFDLGIKYQDIALNPNIKLINDKLYLSLNNLNASIKLDTIKGLINNTNSNKLEVSEIIDLVFDLLDNINLKDLSVSLKKDKLNELVNKYISGLFKEDLFTENLVATLAFNDGVNLSLNTFNLNAKASKTDKTIILDKEYVEIDDLVNNIVDIVKDILDDNGARLNINANINLKELANIDLSLGLTGYVDILKANDKFTISSLLTIKVSNTEIEVKILFKDDNLTVSILDNVITLSIDEIKELINDIKTKFLSNTNNNESLDINSIINGLSLTNTGISADLSSLLSKLGTLALTITSDKIALTNDSIDGVITFDEVKEEISIDGTSLTYSDISSLLDKVKTVVDVIKDEKLDLALSLKYKDIEATITGLVDFTNKEDIKLAVLANIKYKDINLEANIKLINNVIYLDLANIHGSLNIDTIKNLLSDTNNESLDINSLIDKLYPVLSNINLKTLTISLDKVELNNLVSEYLSKLVKEDLFTEDLVLSLDINDNVTLSANAFDLAVTVSKATNEVSLDSSVTYVELDNLVDDVVDIIKDILDDNGARLNINANINLKDLANIDLTLGLTGYVDILKANDKFVISSLLTVKVSETEIEVKVLFKEDTLTVSLLDNVIALSIDEIKELINDIKTKFLSDNSESTLDISSIIDCLSLTVSGVSFDSSSLIEKLDVIALTITSDKIDITNDNAEATITFGEVADEVTFEGELLTYNDISSIIDKVKTIVDIIKDKKLDLALSLKYKDIEASITGVIDFVDDLKLMASANIKYKDIDITLDIKLIDKVLYLDLANIHGSLKLETIKGLIGDSETTIDINEIIDLVFKSLEKVDLKNLNLTLTTTELNKFINDLAGSIIKEDLLEDNLVIDIDVTDKVTVTLNQFDLSASIAKSTNEVALDTNTTYVEIDTLVDDVVVIIKDILDDNGARLNINANINLKELANIDLSLGLTGYVDILKANDKFTISSLLTIKVSNTEIEVKVLFKDDTLTISLLDNVITLSIDEIKELINDIKTKFLSDNSESTLDISSIIDGLSLTGSGVSFDSSSLIEKLGVIALAITSDKITLTNDSIDGVITFDEAKEEISIDGTSLTYSDISSIIDKVKTVVDVIKDKKLDLALSLKYKDIEATITGLVDFTDKDDIKLSVTANIKYKDINLEANIKLINNVIYLDLANIHGSLNIDTIKNLLSDTNNESLDINSLIDKLYPVLSNINLKTLTISLDKVELNNLVSEYLSKLVKEDLFTEDLVLSLDINDNVTLSANAFDLAVTVSKATNEVALDSSVTYVELDNLVDDLVDIIKDILDDNGARLNINANINLKELLKMDLSVGINGYVNIYKDNEDKFVITSALNIKVKDYLAEFKITFKDGYLMVEGFNNSTKLSVDEIKSIIERIESKYFTDKSLSLDINTIIDNILITNDDIKLDLSSITDLLKDLVLVVNDGDISLTNDSISLDVEIAQITDEIVIESYNIDYARVNNLLDNFDYIYDIIMNKKSYEFTFDLDVFDNYEKNIDTYGTINVIIKDDGALNVKIAGHVIHNNIDHDVEVIYISNPKDEEGKYQFLSGNIYFIYGNNCGSSEKLKFSSSVDNILLIIESAASLLGIEDLDIKEDPKALLGLVEKLDLGAGTNNSELVISDLLNELVFTDDSLSMDISNKLLFHYATRLMNVTIKAKEGELSGSLTGIYTKYLDEANNTMLNINSFKLTNNTTTITIPSVKYEISDSHKLVEGLVNLVKTNNIGISGTVSLKVPVISAIDVPVELLVEIYKDEEDKMKFRGYIYLDMTGIPSFATIIGLSKKEVTLYYDDGMVYIYRQDKNGSAYKLKIAQETFMEDIVYYLLDFAMGMPDIIMSAINSDTSDEQKPINAVNAWTKYQYSNNSFALGFDIGELAGNSDLGVLTLTMNLGNVTLNEESTYMLKSITGVNFELVGGIINIKSSSLSVANITSGTYHEIDSTFIKNYTDGYSYDVDKIYKDNKYQSTIGHTISFIYGLDLGGSSVNGVKGTVFSYPNIGNEIKEFDGNYYKFDGWYLDKGFTEAATSNTIGDKSIKIYAKWLNVTSTLTLHSIDGVYSHVLYNDADLSAILTHVAGDLYYESATDKSYQFKYYSLTEDGEEYQYNLMPEGNLTIYEVWFEKIFYVRVNDTITELKDYGFNESYYYVPKSDMYYGYNTLTKEYLLSEYPNSFIFENEKYIIDLKTSLDGSYKILSFDFNSNFNDKDYSKIASIDSNNFSYDMLPNGTYTYNGLKYVINYWYNGSSDYYNDQTIRTINSSLTLYAYYSLSTEYFGISNGKVTSLNASASNIMLIIPKYYNRDGGVITSLGNEAFMGNGNISSVYLNEGMTTIYNDAFKNCTSLRNVYFSNTITNVEQYAFYYEILSGWFNTNDFETSRDYAKELRFYMTTSSPLYSNHSNWQACHWNSSKKYYGNNYSSSGKADLRNAFQTYSEGIETKVHNLF